MIKLRVGPVVAVVNCKKLKENVIIDIYKLRRKGQEQEWVWERARQKLLV